MTNEEQEQRMKQLWRNKQDVKKTPEEFYEWFISQEQKCCYCEITEQEIEQLDLLSNGQLTKRTRGKHLELDRKIPELSYDLFDNLALACYWCNNAKTDTFTHDEFKIIGKAIKQIWQDRLKALN